MLGCGGDRADPRLVAVGGHEDLDEAEERRQVLAFARRPRAGVRTQVGDRLGDGGLPVGADPLDDGERNAVDEQHGIEHHEPRSTVIRAVEPEVSDEEQVVVLGVAPVDEGGNLGPALVPAGQSFDWDALQQQLRDLLVCLNDVGLGTAQLANDPVDAGVVKPVLAAGASVDLAELGAQSALDDLVGPGGATVNGVVAMRSTVNVRGPTERAKKIGQ